MVTLAEEITKSAIPVGSRKINGKYIQSHLLSRLEGMIMFLSSLQIDRLIGSFLLYDGCKMCVCILLGS